MFRPVFSNQVEIEPFKLDKVIFQEKDDLIETGKIVSFKNELSAKDYGLKVGDIIFFEGWGCTQTEVDPEGKKHWVVLLDEKIVKGVYEPSKNIPFENIDQLPISTIYRHEYGVDFKNE